MLEDESATRIVLLHRDRSATSFNYRSEAYLQRRYFGLIYTNHLLREEFTALYLKSFQVAIPLQDLPFYFEVFPFETTTKTSEIVSIVHALDTTSIVVPEVDVMPLLLQNWTGHPAIKKLEINLSESPSPIEILQRLIYVSHYLREDCATGAISEIIMSRTVSSHGTIMTIELSAEVNGSSDVELKDSVLYQFLRNSGLDWRKGSIHILCQSGNFVFDNHHPAWIERKGVGRGGRFKHRRRLLFNEIEG
jgi:hypothetical protein